MMATAASTAVTQVRGERRGAAGVGRSLVTYARWAGGSSAVDDLEANVAEAVSVFDRWSVQLSGETPELRSSPCETSSGPKSPLGRSNQTCSMDAPVASVTMPR